MKIVVTPLHKRMTKRLSLLILMLVMSTMILFAQVDPDDTTGNPDDPTGDTLGDETSDTTVPLDSGVVWLVAAGVGYGILKQMKEKNTLGEKVGSNVV